MKKLCTICGKETAKFRNICKGCQALKRIAKSKDKTPGYVVKIATKHVAERPEVLEISFKSFFKKNTKTII